MPDKQSSRITVDPETGRLMLDGQLMDRQDPRMWGASGQYLEDSTSAIQREGGYDPRYYEAYQDDAGDGNMQTRYRVRPEIRERLGGRVQLSQSGVGGPQDGQGYHEVIDPSLIEWDDEFGMITSPDNIKGQDPQVRQRNMLRAAAIMAVIAGPAVVQAMTTESLAAAAGSGLGGSAGEAAAAAGMGIETGATGAASAGANAATGAGLGGSAGEAAAVGGMGGATAAPGAGAVVTDAGLISGVTAPSIAPLATAPAIATGSPSWISALTPSSQTLIRAGLSAAGTAAQSVLGARAQEENRNLARDQQERAIAERRAEEDRARAERERNGTPTRLNVRITPRSQGVIGSTMNRGG